MGKVETKGKRPRRRGGLAFDLVLSRAILLGKRDSSWSGPGPFGLRHWLAAHDPKAGLGTTFYPR